MSRLLDRLVTADEREGFLAECLDTLVEQFDAERALVLQAGPGELAAVVAARGPSRDLTTTEREEISKTIIRRALDTGECVVWYPERLGSTASIEALSITAAMVAPLRTVAWRDASSQTRGVLYVDFRDLEPQVGDAHLELLRGAAALVSVVLELSERLQLAREDLRLARAQDGAGPRMPSLDELLWPPSMHAIRDELASALHGDSTVLLLGESGTGKTALARAIAEASDRQPVVRAVLGASDDLNTITSELFGHERGAFSGAVARRVGLVEAAAGGTLILDEILNLPRHAQQLLLDFAQFGTFRPLGHQSGEPRRVTTRLIAATNGDLQAAIDADKFRLDLYYRLAQVVVHVPPLRARRNEIPLLAEGWLRRVDPTRDWQLSVGLRRTLVSEALPWAGNVRQLETVVQRARERALARDPDAALLEPAHLGAHDLGVAALPALDVAPPPGAAPAPPSTAAGSATPAAADLAERWAQLQTDRDRLEHTERDIVLAALTRYGGVIARAARELGVPRSTLISRMRKLDIDNPVD